MNSDIEQLRTMVAVHDPARHVRVDEAELSAVLERLALTDGLPSERAVRRPRRRRLVAASLTAVAAGALVILSSLVQPGEVGPVRLGPAQALAFTERGDRIEVRIVDPDADPQRYRKEFAAHGLNVDLQLETASPSLVGKMVYATVDDEHDAPALKELEGGRGCGRVWCKAGVSIPKDLRHRVVLVFGRPAKPGENYQLPSADATAPGEPLAGLQPRGRTVSEVLRMARERNVRIVQYLAEMTEGPNDSLVVEWNYNEHVLKPDEVPGSWYVHDVFTGRNPNTIELTVSPSPDRTPGY